MSDHPLSPELERIVERMADLMCQVHSLEHEVRPLRSLVRQADLESASYKRMLLEWPVRDPDEIGLWH